ncbi:hypothetical protein DOTSEDRAFT_69744 [Dothistroma septosporum NZE10]|uniref:Uncharacterized protein n=1 Tax=Dothistroma septosporum (strain NZE10 / CBS 128990) TaxID=675120 RepID=N1PZU7_DOTSN|nr:hypothetical protein DOTSEDRAFT_69744 [Dothistroma septosporum NZE10]
MFAFCISRNFATFCTAPHNMNMGQKQNRKRVRHRPMRGARTQDTNSFPAQRASLQSCSQTSLCAANTMRSRYGALPNLAASPWMNFASNTIHNKHFVAKPKLTRQESAASRDMRIFGGLEDDTDSAEALRVPMLDVMLGLFDGVDYDDSLC